MTEEEDTSKLHAKFKGGGSIVSLPPVFSDDARYLYVAWKNEIISYNAKTAQKVFAFKGLYHRIVGFGYVYTHSEEFIIACASDGKIIIWKANTALKLKELNVGLKDTSKIKYFKVFRDETHDSLGIKSIMCIENLFTNKYEYSLFNLDNGLLKQQLTLKIVEQNKSHMFIDVSGQGQYFVVVQGRSMYYNVFGSKFFKHSIKGRKFTAVACHPHDVAILTGDDTGRIVLWNNVASKNPTQAVYHWHTLPAKAICFSTSGTYFYSGGDECVLVKWNQENSNMKNFLPRLPAPIKHINVAQDNVLIAVATDDNGVQIISPQLNIVNVIQHLVLGTDTSAGITYDPRSKMLMLNGIIGHVQLFSPKDNNLVYSIDVVGQNKLTNERSTTIISTVVTKVAISSNGLWMATVEHRCDPDMFECRLKFWNFDSSKQIFALNTSIEYPHEEFVKDVLFQPSQAEADLLCVTIGEDKKFKVWELINVSTVYHEGQSWKCSGEVTYKNLEPQVGAFSIDGSLIAVGFESTITTWLSNIHELKCSLRHPMHDDNIIHLSFGNGSQCHLLFSVTAKYVSVWNLLTLSLIWSVRVDIALVISDISTSLKGLFTKDKKLYIVDLKSSTPIYSSQEVLKDVGDIQAAAFVPKISVDSDINLVWHKRSCIYFLDSNYELYSIGTEDEEINFDLFIEDGHASVYSHLLPKMKISEVSSVSKTHMYPKDSSSEILKKFLDAPAYACPQLHLICRDILEAMVLEYKDDNAGASEDTKDVEEQDSTKKVEEPKSVQETDLSKIALESTDWVSMLL